MPPFPPAFSVREASQRLADEEFLKIVQHLGDVLKISLKIMTVYENG